jgi:hypothetical protein
MITGGNENAFKGLTVRARTDASQLIQLLPAGTHLESVVQGIIGATAVLSGPTSTPHIQGELGLTDAKLTLPSIGEKPAGAPTSITFEGTLSRDATLWAGQAEVVLPSLRLAAKGKMQFGAQFGLDGALVTGPISLATLPDWITLGGLEAGTLEISLDVKGQGKDWRTWQTTGWVALTNGLVIDKRLDGPVKDLYLRLKLVRSGAELKRLTFRVNDTDASLSGVIRNLHTKPTITMKVESSQLDIDLLIPKGARSQRSALIGGCTSSFSFRTCPAGSTSATVCLMWIESAGNPTEEMSPGVWSCNCRNRTLPTAKCPSESPACPSKSSPISSA